jgi:Arc/MetJ-type ribon-helix-helix transcriptional regulator
VFDKDPETDGRPRPRAAPARRLPEDERIALRCNRKELQLLDSFVANGEFGSRSELMRAALRDFLRGRAQSTVLTAPAAGPSGTVETTVRLRPDELNEFRAYGENLANGQRLDDVLAQLVRRGALELKVTELVTQARLAVRKANEERLRVEQLEESGRDLERRGVVGR